MYSYKYAIPTTETSLAVRVVLGAIFVLIVSRAKNLHAQTYFRNKVPHTHTKNHRTFVAILLQL